MAKSLKKSGQKLLRKVSQLTVEAGEKSSERIRRNFIDRLINARNVRLLILEWCLLVSALIMLALTQAFWFGDSYAADTFAAGGTYTEATVGEVNSMNPLFATTNSEKVLSKLMFATLTAVDRSGHIKAELAETVRSSADGKEWTIKLREGLKWSDGEPITNADVLFTAELLKNPLANTIYDTNLTNVKVAENENGEIVFTLSSPYADFMSALNFPIVPKHILGETEPQSLIEHSFSNAPVTSGAFTFNAMQSNSSSEKVFYLSANSEYLAGEPLVSTFAVHTYADKSEIIDAVNAGTVTGTAELSGADIAKVNNTQFNQRSAGMNMGAFMFFNTTRKTVSSKEMRRAIRQGIDLARVRAEAKDTEALDFPLLSSQIELGSYPTLPERDFEAAKAKIAELSGGEQKHLDIATVETDFLPEVAQAIAEELEALGFEVNVSVYNENQEFINSVISQRSYDILVYKIELGAEPDLLPYYHSSQVSGAGLNLSNYRNALVDDLLLGAQNTVNSELRAKKYQAFLEYWNSDVPAIGLYRPNLTYFYNRNVRTFSNDVRLVTAIDRFGDVADWAVNKITKNKTP